MAARRSVRRRTAGGKRRPPISSRSEQQLRGGEKHETGAVHQRNGAATGCHLARTRGAARPHHNPSRRTDRPIPESPLLNPTIRLPTHMKKNNETIDRTYIPSSDVDAALPRS